MLPKAVSIEHSFERIGQKTMLLNVLKTQSLDAEVSLIRGMILSGFATKLTIAEAESELPE